MLIDEAYKFCHLSDSYKTINNKSLHPNAYVNHYFLVALLQMLLDFIRLCIRATVNDDGIGKKTDKS